MTSTQSITVDLSNPYISPAPVIYAKQGDSKTRAVSVTITDNGKIISVDANTPYRVYFGGIKGNSGCYITGIMNTGTIEFAIPQSALLKSGTVPAEVQMLDFDDNSKVIATMTFSIIVKPCIFLSSAEEGTNSDIDRLLDRTIKAVTTSAEKVPSEIFKDCANLSYFCGEKVKEIGDGAFYGCKELKNIKLSFDTALITGVLHIPSTVKSVGEISFAKCLSIKKIIVDDGVKLSYRSFAASKVEKVILPSDLTEIPSELLAWTVISSMELNENVSVIRSGAFRCSPISKLILRKNDRLVSIENSDILSETPIADGNGYIYVPDPLIEKYKTADKWKAYASQFKKLSEL